MRFYAPYIRAEEVMLPPIKEGDTVWLKRVIREDKFTRPPPRYNPSSLLKKMEEEGIGTKATRADIIETLYSRGYIAGERIVVTDLGFDVIETLHRYCPDIISVELTRELEERMSQIQNNNGSREMVLIDAVERLKPILEKFRKEEEKIGQALSEAIKRMQMQKRIVGDCPQCTGKLIILYSRKTRKRFIGCTNYFKNLCKLSFPLPQRGTVKPAQKNCKACGWPLVQVRIKETLDAVLQSRVPEKEEQKMKCAICRREAYERKYCEIHARAYRCIHEKYDVWKDALSVSWEEYLSEIIKNPYTGSWAKEVAEHLLKKAEGELPDEKTV